jgi:hypothetical protein
LAPYTELHLVVTASFEDVEKTMQVALQVSIRIDDGVSYTGLCGEIHHIRKLLTAEKLIDELLINQVSFLERKAGELPEVGEPGPFQVNIIVIVEIIDTGNHVPKADQLL